MDIRPMDNQMAMNTFGGHPIFFFRLSHVELKKDPGFERFGSGISTGGEYVHRQLNDDYDGEDQSNVFTTPTSLEQNDELTQNEIYNLLITTLFMFFLLTSWSLLMFVLLKKKWCPCYKGLPGMTEHVFRLDRDLEGSGNDGMVRSPGRLYHKPLIDSPPPYENPPDYFTLPREFLLDPKKLTNSLSSLKASMDVSQKPEQDIKIDIQPEVHLNLIPKAPPRSKSKSSPLNESSETQNEEKEASGCSQLESNLPKII